MLRQVSTFVVAHSLFTAVMGLGSLHGYNPLHVKQAEAAKMAAALICHKVSIPSVSRKHSVKLFTGTEEIAPVSPDRQFLAPSEKTLNSHIEREEKPFA